MAPVPRVADRAAELLPEPEVRHHARVPLDAKAEHVVADLVPGAVRETGQVDDLARRACRRKDREVDLLPLGRRRERPPEALGGHPPPAVVQRLRVRDALDALREPDPRARREERCPEGDVVAPHELDRHGTLVDERLRNLEPRRSGLEPQLPEIQADQRVAEHVEGDGGADQRVHGQHADQQMRDRPQHGAESHQLHDRT